MKNRSGDKNNRGESQASSVELKYCERCGGLWLRESGSLEVYCRGCIALVAELPQRKKQPGRVKLPVGPRIVPVVGDFEFSYEDADDGIDVEASGGAA